MHILTYQKEHLTLAVAKTQMQPDSIKDFSDIVTKDHRIIPYDRTEVGFQTDTDARVWIPSAPHEHALGVALVPRIYTTNEYMPGTYAFGFQGKEDGTYISGLFKSKMLRYMYPITVGENVEGSLESFFEQTELESLAFRDRIGEKDRQWFDERAEPALKMILEHEFMGKGYYMCIPLFLSEPSCAVIEPKEIR